jgi:hypothetical protein
MGYNVSLNKEAANTMTTLNLKSKVVACLSESVITSSHSASAKILVAVCVCDVSREVFGGCVEKERILFFTIIVEKYISCHN